MARFTKANAPKKVRRDGKTYTLRGTSYVPDAGGPSLDLMMMLTYIESSGDSASAADEGCRDSGYSGGNNDSGSCDSNSGGGVD